mmetsp:Transcript_20430/g.42444  ORF Transcript_20430/g.42444 Transcript_20430/m.42444 type:complete len:245 (+) Transcript_20430:769-1503(+)
MTFLPNRKPGPDRLRIRCSIHHYLPLEVSLESSSEKIRPEETIHVEYPPLRPGNTIECHGFSGGFDPSVASDPFNFERASGACKAIPCGSSTTSRVQSPSITRTWSIRSFHRRNDPSPEPHEDFRTTSQGRIRRVPKPREASPPSRRTARRTPTRRSPLAPPKIRTGRRGRNPRESTRPPGPRTRPRPIPRPLDSVGVDARRGTRHPVAVPQSQLGVPRRGRDALALSGKGCRRDELPRGTSSA